MASEKNNMKKITLKQAIEQDKLSGFIKQNKDLVGDKQEFDKTINAMSNNSKSTPQTSTEDSSEN